MGNLLITPVNVSSDEMKRRFSTFPFEAEENEISSVDEWERYLNFYSLLNDDFADIHELKMQVRRFYKEQRTQLSASHKRKHTSDADETDTSTS
jgi:hypothetical protein